MDMDADSMQAALEATGPIPAVDASDLRAVWNLYREIERSHPGGQVATGFELLKRACSPTADIMSVWYRCAMLRMLLSSTKLMRDAGAPLSNASDLLSPWLRDGELDDAVLRVAAKFPMEKIGPGIRTGLPFDVDEFLKQVEAEDNNS